MLEKGGTWINGSLSMGQYFCLYSHPILQRCREVLRCIWSDDIILEIELTYQVATFDAVEATVITQNP
jgi:hypothetical protein